MAKIPMDEPRYVTDYITGHTYETRKPSPGERRIAIGRDPSRQYLLAKGLTDLNEKRHKHYLDTRDTSSALHKTLDENLRSWNDGDYLRRFSVDDLAKMKVIQLTQVASTKIPYKQGTTLLVKFYDQDCSETLASYICSIGGDPLVEFIVPEANYGRRRSESDRPKIPDGYSSVGTDRYGLLNPDRAERSVAEVDNVIINVPRERITHKSNILSIKSNNEMNLLEKQFFAADQQKLQHMYDLYNAGKKRMNDLDSIIMKLNEERGKLKNCTNLVGEYDEHSGIVIEEAIEVLEELVGNEVEQPKKRTRGPNKTHKLP